MTKKKGTKKGGCKKFLIASLLSLVFSGVAVAQTVENDLVGLGMKPELAEYLSVNIPAGAVLDNDVYFKGSNQAGSANINIAKIDSSDNTVINSSASDELILQLEDDASRLISFTAASDAAIAMKFGDAGTTATQILTVTASTSDADDDSSIRICGGGAYGTDGTRGACIVLPGEEVAGGSDIVLNAGAGDTISMQVAGTAEATLENDQLTVSGAAFQVVPGATSFSIRNNADSADNLLIADAGTVTTAAGITATTGNITATAGSLVISDDSSGLRMNVGAYLASAGSVQGDAAAIVDRLTPVTGGDGTKGVILPASPTDGDFYVVINDAAGALKVYPGTGDVINQGAANASVTIAAEAMLNCYAFSAGLWYCSEIGAP